MGKLIKWNLAEKWSVLRTSGKRAIAQARERGAEDAQSGAIHTGDDGRIEGPGIGVFEQELARNAYWPVYDFDRDSEQAHELLAPLWSEYKSVLSRREELDARIEKARIASDARRAHGNVQGEALDKRHEAQVNLDLAPLKKQRDELDERLAAIARSAEDAALPLYRRMTSRRRAEAREHLARANELLNHYISGAAPYLDTPPRAQAMDDEWVESMWRLYRHGLQGGDADDGRFYYDFSLHLPSSSGI